MKETTTKQSERFVRMRELTERLQVSRATIYKMIKDGRFPAPIKLGKSSCWPNSAINKIMIDGISLGE